MPQDIWNLLLLIATILAVAVPWWYSARGSRKELTYEYEATELDETKGVSSKLKMTFDGHPVSDVSLIKIKIRNSGRVPITRTDFDEPISIDIFSNGLLSVDRGTSSPPSLVYELAWQTQRRDISLGTLLLNPTDEINLSVLATSFQKVVVRGRVVGVKQIKQKDPTANAAKVPAFLSAMLAVGATLVSFRLGVTASSGPVTLSALLPIVLLTASSIVLLVWKRNVR